jgi:hypothetical protein
MTPAANLDWLFTLLGCTLAAAGAALLLWSLFWDRPRGRRRCPRCWYDMGGVPGLVCPECGRVAALESHLRKTRRRPRYGALAAVLLLSAWVAASVPGYRRGGWVRLVPSSALVLLMPAEPNWFYPGSLPWGTFAIPLPRTRGAAQQALFDDLWRRLTAGELARWQSQLYLSRLFRADTSMHPAVLLMVPPRWPADQPLPVRELWAPPAGLTLDLRLPGGKWTGPEPGLNPFLKGTRRLGDIGVRWLGLPRIPGSTVTLEMQLRMGATPFWRGEHAFPIEISATAATFLKRLDSPEDTELVRDALRPRLVRTGQRLDVCFDHRNDEPRWQAVYFLPFFSAELRRNGTVLARGRGGPDWWCFPAWITEESVELTPEPSIDLAAVTPPLELVLRGDPEGAGRDYLPRPFDHAHATCWAGELVISITEIPESRAPAPVSSDQR